MMDRSFIVFQILIRASYRFSILIEHIYHTFPLSPSNMLKTQLAQF